MAQVEAWRRCAETRLELNEGQGQGQDLDHDLDQDNDKHHPSSSTPSSFEPSDDHWRVRGPGELSILTRFGRASTADNQTSFPSRLTFGRQRPSTTNSLPANDVDEGDEEENDDDLHYPMMTSSTPDSLSALSSASLSARTSLPKQEEQSHHIQPQTAKQNQRNGHKRAHNKGRRRRGRSGGGNFWDHLLHRGKGNNHDDGSIDTKDGHDLDAPWDDQHRLELEEELHRVWIRQRTHWRRYADTLPSPYAYT